MTVISWSFTAYLLKKKKKKKKKKKEENNSLKDVFLSFKSDILVTS